MFNKTHKFAALCLSLAMLSNAHACDSLTLANGACVVGSLSIGPIWHSNSTSQTLLLSADNLKAYVGNNKTQTEIMGELFLGLARTLNPGWIGQLGLSVATATPTTQSGVIWNDANPNLANLNYSYQIRHTRFAVKGKIQAAQWGWFNPFIFGSAGVSYNQTRNFSNTARINLALPHANFNNRTTTGFSYSFGLGGQIPISSNASIGIAYEFADWGKSELAPGLGQSVSAALPRNNFVTHGAIVNFTYTA